SGYALAIERGAEIRLWPNGAPGSEGETAAEVFESAANSKLPKRFTVVHYPSIYVFPAAKEKANGMAVVVAPGVVLSQLVIDKEGWEIADWLNRNGIAAFVLKYRLARAAGSHYTVERDAKIRLWPNGAPGSEGETAAEVFESAANSKLPKLFTVVHYPSIYVFLAAKEKANGMAVVVAPGGGHSQLVIDKEGWEIAEWLNRNGIAAFVLKYRLARAAGSHYSVERDALADAARAVRTVRSRAAEWGVDPAHIGFMGFSAGGELTALIETRFDAGNAGAG